MFRLRRNPDGVILKSWLAKGRVIFGRGSLNEDDTRISRNLVELNVSPDGVISLKVLAHGKSRRVNSCVVDRDDSAPTTISERDLPFTLIHGDIIRFEHVLNELVVDLFPGAATATSEHAASKRQKVLPTLLDLSENCLFGDQRLAILASHGISIKQKQIWDSRIVELGGSVDKARVTDRTTIAVVSPQVIHYP